MQQSTPSSIIAINSPSSADSPTKCLTPVAPEIGQGLLLEVRRLQGELHEKLEKIKELETDKAELKKTIEALKRQLDISKEAEDRGYSDKRKEKYGICSTCKKFNTDWAWCQKCDPLLLTQGWTSDNEILDELIKNTQLEATNYNNYYYLEWIPYEDIKINKEIGRGGFATIYSAIWLNGKKYVNNNHERYSSDIEVALKRLHNSQNISDEFLNELKNYIELHHSFDIIHIFGLTKDPITKDYIFIMKYLKHGSLQNYLSNEFKKLRWFEKLGIISTIINGLIQIHEKKIIHQDLHSGNILQDHLNSYITDLGLSIPIDKTSSSSENIVIGVLPYIAPEVLGGKPYTMESDIYSIGVLMSVVSTGQQPFSNLSHGIGLSIKICEGLRPAFSNNTPKFYIELAYKCMDADPKKRPTAKEIKEFIKLWQDSCDYNIISHEAELIKNTFGEMDKIKFNPSTITATIHPNAVYTSRLLKFPNLPQPVNSNKVTIIANDDDSQQMDLDALDELPF